MSRCPLGQLQRQHIRAQFASGKRVFRGTQPVHCPADPGDFGIGTYHTTSKARARCHGRVAEHVVTLHNPLVMESGKVYELIAERFMTCRGTMASRKTGAVAATRVLRCLGFDGVVSVSLVHPELEVLVFPPV